MTEAQLSNAAMDSLWDQVFKECKWKCNLFACKMGPCSTCCHHDSKVTDHEKMAQVLHLKVSTVKAMLRQMRDMGGQWEKKSGRSE